MKRSLLPLLLLAVTFASDANADCGPLGIFSQWIDAVFVSDMDGESIPTSDLACIGEAGSFTSTRYDMDGESIPTSDRYDMDGESIPTSDRYDMDGESIPTSD